jgi:Ankyrin repeats (3 copies)/Ankyrin repeat
MLIKMESPFKQLDIVALSALARNMDDKTLLSACNSDKYFNSKICQDDAFWKRRLDEKYPLLIEFKNGTWKEFYLRMSYYIAKLEEEFEIPYILTKGYNSEDFYKEFKDSKYIFDTAMTWAAQGGHMEIVKLMIEKGATGFDWAMADATKGGNMEIVKFMIEKGATNFARAMCYAAEGGEMEIVKLMIEKGATNFNTGMKTAARGGHMDIVKFMIEKGATDFNRAMINARKKRNMDIVNYLKQFIKK